MSEAPPSRPIQYWIFQALPERFDLSTAIKPGEYESWPLTRFQKAVVAGDVVLLWSGGADAGLYGWCTVLDVSGDGYANLQYRGVLETPLLRDDLKAHPDLSGLTILRNPSGTNFRVTALEAQQLCALMEIARPEPPPPPEKDQDDRHPARRLLDYRYSNTPSRVLNACIQVAAENGNGTIFRKLITEHVLALARVTDPARPDSTAFLREALPDLSSLPLPFAESTNWAGVGNRIDEQLLEKLAIKETALRLLATARRAAILSTGRERITLRHLIAAILHGATPRGAEYLADLLSSMSLHPDTVKQAFIDYMAKHWPDDRPDGWVNFFREAHSTETAQAASQLLALLDADATRGMDHLNIRDEVSAFATLLTAKDVNPPLAIGLFGDWGSGKTFFMKEVRREVDSLAAQARAQDENNSPFYGRTAQIWFNAWHYSETDLWASLIDHFFSELKTQIEAIDKEDGKSRYQQLLKKLDLSKTDAEQLQDEVEKAAQKREQLTSKRDELVMEIATKRKLAKDLDAKQAEASAVEDPIALTRLRERADDIEKIMGIAGFKDKSGKEDAKLDEVVDLIRDSQQLTNQLSGFVTGVVRGTSGMQWLTAALLLFVVPYLVIQLTGGINDLNKLLIALTAASGALHKPIQLSLGLLGLLRKTTQNYDKKKQSQTERQITEQRRLNDDISKLNHEISMLTKRLKASSNEHDRLKTQYQEMLQGSLFEFVLERVDSNQYQEHLGLLSTVRQDFERLDKLMATQRSQKTYQEDLPSIDRIILYIDDLDRCPPERVVQVLEAIHLILAFPLFMVVVGVDARWVGRSLKEKYPFLIHFDGETNQDKRSTDLYAASTDDYLEKIFQVPFWLKPIDDDMAKQLISGLLDDAKKKQESKNTGSTPQAGSAGGESQDPETPEETEDEASDYSGDQESSTSTAAAANALNLSTEESNYMDDLAPLVGRSPRTVKRFINLYRLFRASNTRAQTPDFSTTSGRFRAPMLLLAIATGRPRVSNRLFDLIIETTSDKDLIDQIKKNGLGSTTSGSTDSESKRWVELNALLDAFWKADDKRIPLAELTDWIEEVARFSYREWRRGFKCSTSDD